MNVSQMRVKLAVGIGVLAASLLGATLTGCQSGPGYPNQRNGYFGQSGNASPGQQLAGFGQNPGNNGGPQAPMGAPGYMPPSNQQAFMAEMQRMGGQQNLSPQDVVAMAHSGVPDEQILAAIQQRGAQFRGVPGIPDYLAQNGVSPRVVDALRQSAGQPAGQVPPQFAAQTYGQAPVYGDPASAAAQGTPVQGDQGQPVAYSQAQAAGMTQPFGPAPSMETPGPVMHAGFASPAWRPKTQ